jgi:putative peptide zinc metalloprotease protein
LSTSFITDALFMSPGDMPLLALREDLALQPAPCGQDGAPHWHIHDPVRNRFFRLGWLEFELLVRWRAGMTADALCAVVAQETVLTPEPEDVLSLYHFLESNELARTAAPQQRNKLLQMAQQRKLSIGQWLLHHYLFIRIPLVKPEAFLARTQRFLEYVFQPAFFFWVATLSFIGVLRVIDQWSAFSGTFLYFFSWQGALFYGLALALAKILHELGHAYTARHYGLRVPTMGVAFMMMWPLLYTDTSEGWKLTSRRARLAIGGAGVIAELLLAGLAALVWSFCQDGTLKSAAYILAAVTWISTLAINLNPFMRFDGYYLLMDTVDMPNLHERSFAFGRWYLRRHVLGIIEPVPEPEFESRSHWLILYAYATWLYRLIMFTGIAAAVYYFFFKAAGLILFAVEIGWFVVRPIWNELKVWWLIRDRWRHHFAFKRSLLLLLLFITGLAVPWHTTVKGEGYWQASQHTRMYPPAASRVTKILVQEGQTVTQGEPLFMLESPEVEWQLQALESRIKGLQAQLAGSVSDPRLLERSRVLEQELGAANAEHTFQLDEQARLHMVAPHAGIFRDLDHGLYPGAWVGPQRILGRVVGGQALQTQVFVNETDITRIHVGAHARLLMRRPDTVAVDAIVTDIDPTASRILPEPMLASTHGGSIAVRPGPRGELTVNEALYRVTLKTDHADTRQMVSVVAHIDGDNHSFLWNFFRQAIGILIRESGF